MDKIRRAYELYYSKNTRDLMESYVLRFRDSYTRDAYMNVYERFAEHVKKDWFECGAEDYKSFMADQSERYQTGEIAYSTYVKYYKIISAFSRYIFKLAHSKVTSPIVPPDYKDYSAVAWVKSPADVFHAHKIPVLSEVEKVLAYTKVADKLTYFAILFSIGTFVKTGEFLRIKAKDLMQDAAGTWFIRLSDGYMVLLDEGFGSELADYVEAVLARDDLLFSRKTKEGIKPITDVGLRKRLLKACRNTGVKNFTFNELRNAAAVYTATAGATKEEIASSMRYKSSAHIERLTSLILPKRKDASRFIHFTLNSDNEANA